jgi:hypothetical protein
MDDSRYFTPDGFRIFVCASLTTKILNIEAESEGGIFEFNSAAI